MSTAELFVPDAAQEISLWDWQDDAVEGLRVGIREKVMNQICAAPTGAGKTILGTYLLQECREKGKRGLFVADRIPLIDQTSATFDRYGLPHGVIQADHWRTRPWERIQVASAQTLERRGWPDADLIIVDEAHSLYRSVLRRIGKRDTVVIGLTATPFTKGLGRHYDRVITVRTTAQLIADGILSPYEIFAPSEPDMTGAKVAAGEWTDDEAARRSLPIVGDVVAEYMKHAYPKKFICFGVNVAHCEELERQFSAAGVQCGLYTYRTTDEARAQMLRDFRERGGYLQGLISVAALAKGFDDPTVEVVILARPLRKSLAEHIQMFGRGLRRDPDNPGKVCTILDHSGNCVRFWAPMMDFFERGVRELDDGKPKESKKSTGAEKEAMKCPRCAYVHDPRPSCPKCGHEYPRRQAQVEHVAGTLSKLTGLPAGGGADQQAVYSQLLHMARDRGKDRMWARYRFKDRFGEWPSPNLRDFETPPTPELERWVRSQTIRYLKGRGKAGAR